MFIPRCRVVITCSIGLICLGGCRPAKDAEGGPLRAGPYAECRTVTAWIRMKTEDPEATVTKWGSRREAEDNTAPGDGKPVLIDVHYVSADQNGDPHNWSQTVRVIGQHVQEETRPVAE